MPFFLQSSTLRAVLQLLAVQGEYANLTAPHDPDPPSLLKDPQPCSPSVSPPLTQIPLNTSVEYKALGHTTSDQSSGDTGSCDRLLADVLPTEAIAQKECYVNPVMTSGSSTSEELILGLSVTESKSERETPIISIIDVPPSPALFTAQLPINPVPHPAQLTPAVANSSSDITSSDPLAPNCPPPAGSLGPDNSFPEITHSLAEETALPEPQLAVSTGSSYIKIIYCLFHTQLNPPYGVLHAPSLLPRALILRRFPPILTALADVSSITKQIFLLRTLFFVPVSYLKQNNCFVLSRVIKVKNFLS